MRGSLARSLLIFFLLGGAAAHSQDMPAERLEQGLVLFEKSDFPGALSVFQGILLDARAKAQHPAAAYWSALSFVGLKDYANADTQIGLFLSRYQGTPLYADALYQQGRIAYLMKESERALRTFQVFLESYPGSDLYAAALFWSGECLFQLGRLEQAERVFQAIVKDYPEGVKTEAASYRLNLIDLKYREDELLMLLKWSHEESLRVVEEYQRREKAYEQAVNAYQKQLSGQKVLASDDKDAKLVELQALSDSLQGQAAQKDAKLAELSALIESLERQLADSKALTSTDESGKDARIEELSARALSLERQLAETKEALARSQAAAASASNAQVSAPVIVSGDTTNLGQLLSLKQEALDLKELYLKWIAAQQEGKGE